MRLSWGHEAVGATASGDPQERLVAVDAGREILRVGMHGVPPTLTIC